MHINTIPKSSYLRVLVLNGQKLKMEFLRDLYLDLCYQYICMNDIADDIWSECFLFAHDLLLIDS